MRKNLVDKLSWRRCASALALVLLASVWGAAQSPDLELPTPVTANEINARIAPRDLGDARLTSHFYTFNGTQGDLAVTIESLNLDGAVDLFLTNGLRPLMQITLYAGGGALNVTKTVFLRKDEALILRVQARTPNDTNGTYKIQLSGSFVAAVSTGDAPAQSEATAANSAATKPSGRGVHRVNSVGARIEEPEPAAPKTEAKESAAKKTEATPVETTATTPTPAAKRGQTKRNKPAARTETARRPTPAPKRKPEAAKTDESVKPTDAETARTEPVEPTPNKPAAARTPRPKTDRTTRNPRTKETAKRTVEPTKETPPATETETPKDASAPQIGVTRLIIEVKDGAKVEHEMSSVSRVTVVGGLIVVILKNGHIERYPLAKVLRMAIEP